MERKPIEARQLHALVRAILLEDPAIDYTEWKERALRRLFDWGFESPTPDLLSRSMQDVDRSVRRTLGPPPVIAKPAPPKPLPESWLGTRTTRPAGWAFVTNISTGIQMREHSARSQEAPAARERFPVTEVNALNEFWNEAGWPAANRLALLRAFAEIAILRDAAWDPIAIRAEYEQLRPPMAGEVCFACRSDRPGRSWHHIIQIQHGGSNYVRNRVPICGPCHTTVHPWMDREQRATDGWGSVADLASGRTVLR